MHDDMTILPKKDFGPFELHERIGSGGMGSVYRAVQKSLKRDVVLKILHPHLADDDNLVIRFEREAHAAAQLRHPNICQVIDSSRHMGVPYIAMEYIAGDDLEKWFKRHKAPPPLEIALLILREVCRGLEHAHAAGVIHRDIKPANIMLTKDGAVKIMDFGLARVASETIAMTQAGSVLGTPRYMSPEQASGENVDARSDIFSTGVLGFELLSGQCPFGGESYSAVIHSILYAEPEALQTSNPVVTGPCAELVRRMLRKNADERFQTMSEVLQALGEVRAAMDIYHGKDVLRNYARDPDGVATMLRERGAAHHMQRAREFEGRGPAGEDLALIEYMRVVHLDPGNVEAGARVEALQKKGAKIPAEELDPGDAAPLLSSAPSLPNLQASGPPAVPTHAGADSGRPPMLAIVGGAIVVVAVIGVVFAKLFTVAPGPKTPPPAAAAQDTAGKPTAGTLPPAAAAPGKAVAPAPSTAAAATPPATAEEASATLTVRTAPPGASVTLDGTPLTGATNATYKNLKPGSHTLHLTLDGYPDQERVVRLKPGATVTQRVEFAAKPVKLGYMAFKGDATMTATIDSKPVPAADLKAPVPVPVGTHEIRLVSPGATPLTRSVTLLEGETQTIDYGATLGTGSVLVDCNVRGLEASIWVDGRDTGRRTPRLISGLSARNHSLKLVHPDYLMIGGDTAVAIPSGGRLDLTLRMVLKR